MDKDLEFDEEVSTHSIRSKLNESLLTDEVLTIFFTNEYFYYYTWNSLLRNAF
jgi:hypothetical protein